jgi:hypothetical protein
VGSWRKETSREGRSGIAAVEVVVVLVVWSVEGVKVAEGVLSAKGLGASAGGGVYRKQGRLLVDYHLITVERAAGLAAGNGDWACQSKLIWMLWRGSEDTDLAGGRRRWESGHGLAGPGRVPRP